MNLNIKKITRLGIVAALYVVLTVSLAPISYGPVQLRFSELLNFFAFFDIHYVIALTIGCLIANLMDGNIVVSLAGTIGTLIATTMMFRSKSLLTSSFWPLINAPILAVAFYYTYDMPFWFTLFSITLSQFAIMTLVGYPVFYRISKNKRFVALIKGEDI